MIKESNNISEDFVSCNERDEVLKEKRKKRFRDTVWFRMITSLLILCVCGGIGSGYAYVEFKNNPDKACESFFKNLISNGIIKNIEGYEIGSPKKIGNEYIYYVKYSVLKDGEEPAEEPILDKTYRMIIQKKDAPFYKIIAEYELEE